jgi:GntP family gluconate:H+ symporter
MVHWLQHETGGLLLLCALAIAALLVLIIKIRLEPFIALLVSGLGLALAAGLSVDQIVGTALSAKASVLETGFAGILGHIAPIIGLGTVLGAILEASGGADVLTRKLLDVFGERGVPLAMGVAGLVFGIPVFFDTGTGPDTSWHASRPATPGMERPRCARGVAPGPWPAGATC